MRHARLAAFFVLVAFMCATTAKPPSASRLPVEPREPQHAASKAPRSRIDAVLGRLELDLGLGRWRGKATWGEAAVEVMVDGSEEALFDDALATAHALWDAAEDWDIRARHVAADQLLPLYVDTWREATDGPALDPGQFIERLELRSVVALPEGDFELWYGDDGLFGGHAIRVVGSLVDGPQLAELAG